MTRLKLALSVLVSLLVSGSLTCRAQLMQLDKEELPEAPAKHDKEATVTPCITWIDQDVPVKGYVLCVHGLGLHKGTYQQFGERMAKLGWGVYAVDVRGFGSFQKMPGPAPRTVDFEGCLQDVKAALDFVHKEHPGAPVFIIGESMGGGIALQAAARYPDLVDGLISSVPGAQRFNAGKDSLKVGAHMLAGPKHSMDVTKIVVERSTKKEDLREEWLKDDLGRFELSPFELMQFQLFMNANDKWAKKITATPVLMMSGTEDALVKHEDQEFLIKDIPSQDKHQVYVVGAEHLILEEGQFDENVLSLVDSWLADHSARIIETQAQGKIITPGSSTQ
jgi:alpha-beta hydrolase superfamily lysophospholipase